MEFSSVFTGTAKDFVDNRVALNGKVLDAVAVNVLGRHGILTNAGVGAKPARGRTPQKFAAVNREGFTFTVFGPAAVATANSEPVQAESQTETVAETQTEVTAETSVDTSVDSVQESVPQLQEIAVDPFA